jgi:hypothetical protein
VFELKWSRRQGMRCQGRIRRWSNLDRLGRGARYSPRMGRMSLASEGWEEPAPTLIKVGVHPGVLGLLLGGQLRCLEGDCGGLGGAVVGAVGGNGDGFGGGGGPQQ